MYNVCEALRLAGCLNVEALESSIHQIVLRHESLRTTFAEVDGEPQQVIVPSLRIELDPRDLGVLPEAERETAAAALINFEANSPFDLQKGPLLRVRLIRITAEDHVLAVTVHHSIFEGGWSMGIFLKELQSLYNAYVAGGRAALPDLPVQYGDFAIWQEEWLRGEELARLLEFWKQQLASIPAIIDLPTDRPRPVTQTYRGARKSIHLPLELKARLMALAREENATLFMALLAAFQTLLFRYCAQPHLATGIPVAGRSSPEVQDLIGFFVNTLVLPADFTGDPSFRQLLKQTRQRTLDALSHQDLPFELLVKELRPERTLAYTPLFQVMFAFQNAPRPELAFAGLAVSNFDVEIRTSMFDMTLFAWEKPDGLLATLEYSTDLFDAETIERMLRQFHTLLESIVREPSAAVSALPLLPEDEKQQLLVRWNATARDYPREATIAALVERQAAATPHAPAVTLGAESITYRELNARADRLAGYLRALGVGPGSLAGILVERSPQMVVGLLGILKTGAAYVPLDPIYPPERIAFMLQDSKAAVLLTEETLPRVPGFGGQQVFLDSEWPAISRQEPVLVPVGGADSLAYVIYTSGSTGKPKGVAIAHRNVVNLLESMRETTGFQSRDVLVSVTTLSFDIAGLEIWMPLVCGGRVVVASREVAMDGVALAGELARSRATYLQATPSVWKLLLDSVWPGSARLTALCGGEALPAELADRLRGKVKALWNVYGPTETTIWSAAHHVDGADSSIPIGRPLANTQFYVLDERRQLVPTGVPGELYIGGDGVAAGYLHRPELTAERFVANPFDPSGRSRLYRTGDLVRQRNDGTLLFLGRLDHQVKLRGFRIELGEIADALSRHPALKETVVVLDESGPEKRLVAYAVPRAGEAPPADDLKNWLRESLPEYMVPARFVFLEALPLTPNGKVDRRALPAAASLPPAGEHALVEPRDEYERRLQQIWEQLLGTPRIGVTANFFDLGGHSLLITRLGRRIEQEFGQHLSMAEVFQTPTIEGMATLLRKASLPVAEADCKVFPLQPLGSQPPFICLGAGPFFLPLAVAAGGERPFCGLDLNPLRPGRLSVPYQMKEIAGHVKRAIRAFQPHGPYYLGGWCLFGVLMYEAAHQMMAEGDEVRLLVMIDSPNRSYEKGLPPVRRIHSRLQKWQYHVQEMGRIGAAKIPAFLKHQVGVARLEAQVRKNEQDVERGVETGVSEQDFNYAFQIAARNYDPPRYHGPVLILQTTARPAGHHWHLRNRWRHLVEQLEVIDVPAGHEEMFHEPHVQTLATQLRERLEAGRQVGAAATAAR